MLPINVFLAWTRARRKQGQNEATDKGIQNVKPMRWKKFFLERPSQEPEQLNEVRFLSQGPGASPCHPYKRKSEQEEECSSSDHRAHSVSIIPTAKPWISILGPEEETW